jgi:hypothetical protein
VHAAPTAPGHMPLPSHMSLHGGAPLGSFCPAGTFAHVPTEPAILQAMQVDEQAELQQTPSAQNPDAHSAFVVQMVPLTAKLQAPDPLQVRAHSLSGSVLTAILPQTPLLPLPFFAAEHAIHDKLQTLPQQYPSTQ